MSKSKIKSEYVARLQRTYAFCTTGSRPLTLAMRAADKALAGEIRLEGDCWFDALKVAGVRNPRSATRKEIASLPE